LVVGNAGQVEIWVVVGSSHARVVLEAVHLAVHAACGRPRQPNHLLGNGRPKGHRSEQSKHGNASDHVGQL
jgi:hypothetical protein